MRLDSTMRIGLVEHSDSEEFSDSDECSNSERPDNALKALHLELSIHELCHYRLGRALWTYRRDSDKVDFNDLLMPLRSPTDIFGNSFDENCIGQMKLLAMIEEAGFLLFHGGIDWGLSSIFWKY